MTSTEASALFNVNGLIAVITGGGTGIGLMMTKALAANGASKIYIIGRRADRLDAAASTNPSVITPIVGDVTSKDSLAACAAQIEKEVGHINLLIVNSGIAGPLMTNLKKDASLAEFQSFIWDNWQMNEFNDVYAVNDTAAFFTAIAFLNLLDAGNKAQNTPGVSSQVIVSGSIGGFTRVALTGFAYITSKAAANHMAKVLATSLAPYGIRVNALAPGFFPSEMTGDLQFLKGGVAPTFIPAQRIGQEEDMAGTVLWLASRAGAYISGNVVVMDGGRLSVIVNTY